MGRIGALLATGFEQAACPTALQELLEQTLSGTAGPEAVAALAEHGKVEPRVCQLEPQEILPVKTGAHGFGGLAVRQIFAKLHDRYQGQTPGGQPWVAPGGKQRGKVVVLENG